MSAAATEAQPVTPPAAPPAVQQVAAAPAAEPATTSPAAPPASAVTPEQQEIAEYEAFAKELERAQAQLDDEANAAPAAPAAQAATPAVAPAAPPAAPPAAQPQDPAKAAEQADEALEDLLADQPAPGAGKPNLHRALLESREKRRNEQTAYQQQQQQWALERQQMQATIQQLMPVVQQYNAARQAAQQGDYDGAVRNAFGVPDFKALQQHYVTGNGVQQGNGAAPGTQQPNDPQARELAELRAWQQSLIREQQQQQQYMMQQQALEAERAAVIDTLKASRIMYLPQLAEAPGFADSIVGKTRSFEQRTGRIPSEAEEKQIWAETLREYRDGWAAINPVFSGTGGASTAPNNTVSPPQGGPPAAATASPNGTPGQPGASAETGGTQVPQTLPQSHATDIGAPATYASEAEELNALIREAELMMRRTS